MNLALKSAIKDNLVGAYHHATELEKAHSMAIKSFNAMPDPNGIVKAFREILEVQQNENRSTIRYLDRIRELLK